MILGELLRKFDNFYGFFYSFLFRNNFGNQKYKMYMLYNQIF